MGTVRALGRQLKNDGIEMVTLTGADLTGAAIYDADLTGADLTSADLTDAKWSADRQAPEGWKLDTGSGRLSRAGTGSDTAEAS
jgi:uncharacterized protein YjbI with pentapeptide repeats